MSYPDSIKPSLNEAKARVARASEHIARLEAEIPAALRVNTGGAVVVSAQTTGRFENATDTFVPTIAPPIVAILIGETVYNLKAALDYLVSALFELDNSGKRNSSAKFIIEQSENAWDKYLPISCGGTSTKDPRKLWLQKLTASHRAELKRLQPFPGRHETQWLLTLQGLTNPDRHSRLTWVRSRITHITVAANPSEPAFKVPATSHLPVGVEAQITGEILLKDGARVEETLRAIASQVTYVLNIFEPDFN